MWYSVSCFSLILFWQQLYCYFIIVSTTMNASYLKTRRASPYTDVMINKGRQLFWRKSASGDLAWGFSDPGVTWFLYCAGVCTWWHDLPHHFSDLEMTWLPWRPSAATDCELYVSLFLSTYYWIIAVLMKIHFDCIVSVFCTLLF